MAREMKDSGVEWIGEIGINFHIVKLKHVSTILDQFRKPVTADQRNQEGETLYDYYGASGIIDKINGYTIDDHVMLIGEDGANLKMRNLPIMYEVNGKAWINNHAHILKPKKGIDFYYLFFALEAIDINPYITGSAQPKLSQENMKNILRPVPNISIQKEIVRCIKSTCNELDNILTKTRASIEEYKKLKQAIIMQAVTKGVRGDRELKDSGIEWVGEIPADWEVSRLKSIAKDFSKGSGITKEDIVITGDTPCVRYGEIYSKYNQSFTECVTKTNREIISPQKYFSYGDILFACTGELVEEIGKSIVYLGDRECLAGGDIIILKHEQDPSFLNYAINSSYAQAQKSCGKTKLKVVHISATDIGNIMIALPSISEQRTIANYLDKICAIIDLVTVKKAILLEELGNYKKSLIYEYVTGKKEVSMEFVESIDN